MLSRGFIILYMQYKLYIGEIYVGAQMRMQYMLAVVY